ncbi:MAG: DUF523 and DUF1722 domain-containing protein [Vicinamibacterales bacterium]
MALPIRVGISACLLGDQVRFDGGHKRDPFLIDTMGPFVDWVKVCPEVEAGMGTPRESIRLVEDDGRLRLLTVRTGMDHTAAMKGWTARRVRELAAEDLCGFVVKKDSPSCGMVRVKVYGPPGTTGPAGRHGRGMFTGALMDAFPNLPVEEEGRLSDPRLRENFIERVFAYRRVRDLFAPRWTVGDLVAFHTKQKLVLMAHSPQAYQAIGRLVAQAKGMDRETLRTRYTAAFMEALRVMATARRHANVLQHMLGYFSEQLDPASRAELAQTITDYRLGQIPLVVPVTLIRHFVRLYDVRYLAGQVYLDPHPRELMLRNHV